MAISKIVERLIRAASIPVVMAALYGAGAAAGAIAQLPSPIAGVAAPPGRAVPGGSAVALSLPDAVALGLRNNRGIRSAYLERVAQKFDLVVARSAFIPRATLSGDITNDRIFGTERTTVSVNPSVNWLAPTGAQVGFTWDRRQQFGVGRDASSDIASLFVSQPLLRGGGFDVNAAPIRIAELQDRINKLALRGTVIDTVSAIIFAYRGLLQAQEQVGLAELALQRTRDLLETNRALIDAGRLPAADIVQTEAGLASQQVLVLQAKQTRTSAQLALSQLLAVDPRTNILASEAAEAKHVPIDVERAIAEGLSSRVDTLAQRKAIEQSRQALLVARNNRLWDLSVDASVSRQGGIDPLVGRIDPRTDRSVALRLSIPLNEPSLKQGEIQATTNLRTAELRYEDLQQGVETQIRDAVQTVEGNWLQLESARNARALAAQALELQRAKLAVGRASNFEVLSFQADLRAADTQELTATINYLNALTALDQQIGSTLETWQISLND